MTNKEKLEEATILALQGKLTESSTVEKYRELLKNTQERYKDLNKNDPWYKETYNRILKSEKEYLKDLKKALAQEKGTFVSAVQVTNAIKKLASMEKYTDRTTAIRGFHWYGQGNFEVNTDMYRNSLNEENLYYEVYFYKDKAKENCELTYNVLSENGFVVEKYNDTTLRVMNYKN